jgi:UDP:flavonoid glycosyltransferase YjiC (YdhE family)
MSRFLFTTLPSNDLGLLSRSLPIARELSNRGHEIVFSSPARSPDVLIKEAGFKNIIPKHPFYHIHSKDLSPAGLIRLFRSKKIKNEFGNFHNFFFKLIKSIPIKFAPSTPEIWNMDHAAAMMGMLNKNFVRSQCEAMIQLINDVKPDVIVDFWNPFIGMAARIVHKPIICVIQADGHPANNGFIWWKKPPLDVPSALPTINNVLAGYGLQSIKKTEELNLGDLTLIVGTPEMDPIPDGADGIHIGPLLWQKENPELPAWLNKIDDGKPLIWIYSGNPKYSKKVTVVDSEVILEASIEALANEEIHLILTSGYHSIPEKYLPLPQNFHFEKYIPGLFLAQKCDLMIHHGGYGSCQTGIYAGIPAVIVSTFSERESNARRIASLGAGEYILPVADNSRKKIIDVDEFKSKVRRVLENESYRENAQQQSKILKSYGGPQKAADLIENFLTEHLELTTEDSKGAEKK